MVSPTVCVLRQIRTMADGSIRITLDFPEVDLSEFKGLRVSTPIVSMLIPEEDYREAMKADLDNSHEEKDPNNNTFDTTSLGLDKLPNV